MGQSDAPDYSTQASVERCKGLGQLVARMARTRRGTGMRIHSREQRAALEQAFHRPLRGVYLKALRRHEETNRMASINARLMRAPMVFAIGRVLHPLVLVARQ